jgi:hypothetical protein
MKLSSESCNSPFNITDKNDLFALSYPNSTAEPRYVWWRDPSSDALKTRRVPAADQNCPIRYLDFWNLCEAFAFSS